MVDFLVAVEALESARWIEWLRPGGVVFINRQRIAPMSVTVGDATYPSDEEILEAVSFRTDDVNWVDGLVIAKRLGDARMTNTVLLGALSTRLEIERDKWLGVIERRVPPKYVEMNRKAFDEGRRDVG